MAGGRPRRTSTPDSAVDEVVRRAVEDLAVSARGRRSQEQGIGTSGHLLLAVTAARLAAAADRIAHANVTLAREKEGATWDQVGEAFGTSRQSAHERFRPNERLR